MTNQQHPLTPPPGLVQQWEDEMRFGAESRQVTVSDLHIATRAAQWGADQELEACCNAIYVHEGQPLCGGTAEWLRAARRPKPQSLAEEALALINHDPANQPFLSDKGIDTIRRALERLQQLEEQQ